VLARRSGRLNRAGRGIELSVQDRTGSGMGASTGFSGTHRGQLGMPWGVCLEDVAGAQGISRKLPTTQTCRARRSIMSATARSLSRLVPTRPCRLKAPKRCTLRDVRSCHPHSPRAHRRSLASCRRAGIRASPIPSWSTSERCSTMTRSSSSPTSSATSCSVGAPPQRFWLPISECYRALGEGGSRRLAVAPSLDELNATGWLRR
jgi:hypothetical protein